MLTQRELQDKTDFANNILRASQIDSWRIDKNNLETELSNPDIWSDPTKANELNQKLSIINKNIQQVENIQNLIEELNIAFELNEEKEFETITTKLDSKLEELQNQQFLNGPFDQQGVFLSLFAGAGGLDAQDWTSMICSMYQAFAKNQNWSCRLMSMSVGEEGGLKSATLEITGENVYGLLKEEAGVHRLVRISPFNSGGTRETSFAMVEVLPNDLNQKIDIKIDDKDIRIDTFMASGKGGQGVNTTYSAVRIVHLPTNISVQCQDERSQQMNKDRAMQVLKNKLIAIELKKQKEFTKEIKGNLGQNEWGSQIRSYTLHPYKLVKDHRSGHETTDINNVIEQGNLLPFIWSVKKSNLE
jgi:peptide chain release factor 2